MRSWVKGKGSQLSGENVVPLPVQCREARRATLVSAAEGTQPDQGKAPRNEKHVCEGGCPSWGLPSRGSGSGRGGSWRGPDLGGPRWTAVTPTLSLTFPIPQPRPGHGTEHAPLLVGGMRDGFTAESSSGLCLSRTNNQKQLPRGTPEAGIFPASVERKHLGPQMNSGLG